MRLRVLLVDDNSAFRAAARTLLERGGFDVVSEAATGDEAVHEAAAHRPELAIVDVQLPDVDGFEVAERLANLDDPPRVILTSSLDLGDLGLLVTDSPAVGFLPKGEFSLDAIRALSASAR
jgi:CheY-like chemotaxis protein